VKIHAEMVRDIELHFKQCMEALSSRRASLLTEIETKFQEQSILFSAVLTPFSFLPLSTTPTPPPLPLLVHLLSTLTHPSSHIFGANTQREYFMYKKTFLKKQSKVATCSLRVLLFFMEITEMLQSLH
jgi:hypothetical protein